MMSPERDVTSFSNPVYMNEMQLIEQERMNTLDQDYIEIDNNDENVTPLPYTV